MTNTTTTTTKTGQPIVQFFVSFGTEYGAQIHRIETPVGVEPMGSEYTGVHGDEVCLEAKDAIVAARFILEQLGDGELDVGNSTRGSAA